MPQSRIQGFGPRLPLERFAAAPEEASARARIPTVEFKSGNIVIRALRFTLSLSLFVVLLINAGAVESRSTCVSHVSKSIDALIDGDVMKAGQNFESQLARTHDSAALREVWAALQRQAGTYSAHS